MCYYYWKCVRGKIASELCFPLHFFKHKREWRALYPLSFHFCKLPDYTFFLFCYRSIFFISVSYKTLKKASFAFMLQIAFVILWLVFVLLLFFFLKVFFHLYMASFSILWVCIWFLKGPSQEAPKCGFVTSTHRTLNWQSQIGGGKQDWPLQTCQNQSHLYHSKQCSQADMWLLSIP